MKKFVTWTTTVVFSITLFASLLFLVQDGRSGEKWIRFNGVFRVTMDDQGKQCGEMELVKRVAIESGTQQHRLDYHIGASSNESDASQPDNTHPAHNTEEKYLDIKITEVLRVTECPEEEEPEEEEPEEEEPEEVDDTSGNNDDTSGNNDDTSGNNDDTSGNNDDTSGNNDDSC